MACLVIHPEGTCCHYSETEVKPQASNPVELRKQIEQLRVLLSHYRADVDVAWSEVLDGVNSLGEYNAAHDRLSEKYVNEILALLQPKAQELDTFFNRGKEQ
jgi:hypothetical protein